MKRFAPARSSFEARRPVKTPQALRVDWMSAIALSLELAKAADSGLPADAQPGGFGSSLTRLSVALRDLEPANFPVAAASAQTMAAAFLRLARDFAHPAWTAEARTACAPFLKAGSDCLDRLLDQQRREMSASSRRMVGDREDD